MYALRPAASLIFPGLSTRLSNLPNGLSTRFASRAPVSESNRASSRSTRPLSLLAAAVLATACQKAPAPAPPPAPSLAATTATAPGRATIAEGAPLIHGTVREKIGASGYSYLRLASASGELWVAVPEAQVEAGAEVDVAPQMNMDGFESKTLHRTFAKLVFGVLATPGTAPAAAALAPQARPGAVPAAASGGMAGMRFAIEAAGTNPHAGLAVPPPAAAASDRPIQVAKAKAKDARTVAELHAQRAQLKDRPVTLRGQVVKYNEGILGRNWIHLRDGTGAAGSDDLTVTTTAKASVGEVVTVHGTLHLDKDFGAGYAYGVIIEDASVEKAAL